MRNVAFFTITSLSVAACGGGDDTTTPDAAVDIGFNLPLGDPSRPTTRSPRTTGWSSARPTSRLNTPSNETASANLVTLTGKVADFQSGNAVPGAKVEVFKEQNYMTVENTATADGTAAFTVDLPAGVKRFGYKMTASSAMPTFLLNQTLASPTETAQNVGNIRSVSNATAATLPALIGQTRTPTTGVVAGALRDCDGHEVSGFIATMSSTSATATTVTGADTYYFDSAVGLPVHHNRQKYSSGDGLFMIIEIPSATDTGYVQMWGFPTDADLAKGQAGLKLIAELKVPVLADTVITGSYEPLRTN